MSRHDLVRLLEVESTVSGYFNCIGRTVRGARCKSRIAKANETQGLRDLSALTKQPLQGQVLRQNLEEAAARLLCVRHHQGQAASIAKDWARIIEQSGAVSEAQNPSRAVPMSRDGHAQSRRNATAETRGRTTARQQAVQRPITRPVDAYSFGRSELSYRAPARVPGTAAAPATDYSHHTPAARNGQRQVDTTRHRLRRLFLHSSVRSPSRPTRDYGSPQSRPAAQHPLDPGMATSGRRIRGIEAIVASLHPVQPLTTPVHPRTQPSASIRTLTSQRHEEALVPPAVRAHATRRNVNCATFRDTSPVESEALSHASRTVSSTPHSSEVRSAPSHPERGMYPPAMSPEYPIHHPTSPIEQHRTIEQDYNQQQRQTSATRLAMEDRLGISRPGQATDAVGMDRAALGFPRWDLAPALSNASASATTLAAPALLLPTSTSPMSAARSLQAAKQRDHVREFVDLTDDEQQRPNKPLRFVAISEEEGRRLSGLLPRNRAGGVIDLTDDFVDTPSSRPKLEPKVGKAEPEPEPDACTICMDDLPLEGKEMVGEVLRCPWCTNCMHWACYRVWRDRQHAEGRDGSACPQCRQDFGYEANMN